MGKIFGPYILHFFKDFMGTMARVDEIRLDYFTCVDIVLFILLLLIRLYRK